MTKLKLWLAAGAMAAGFAGAAEAAWYAKFDGVDGSVKSVQWKGERALWLTVEENDTRLIGLLVPAVQKVRAASARSGVPHVRVFSSAELRDGNTVWTLYNAQATPTAKPNRIKIVYRCKDWVDTRTGETGSDCAARAGENKKKGNVEYGWKVEEGES